MLCEFASGARGTFEASRSIVGPRARWRSRSTAPRARSAGTSSSSTSCSSTSPRTSSHTGYRTVLGGDRFPYHGHFVPGSANGIGFEDLVVIEDYEFCRSVAEGRAHAPGFARRRRRGSASRRRCCARRESGRWEDVVSLRED